MWRKIVFVFLKNKNEIDFNDKTFHFQRTESWDTQLLLTNGQQRHNKSSLFCVMEWIFCPHIKELLIASYFSLTSTAISLLRIAYIAVWIKMDGFAYQNECLLLHIFIILNSFVRDVPFKMFHIAYSVANAR